MTNKEYTVTWTIQVQASSPRQAAWEALAIQRDVFSDASCFDVKERSSRVTCKSYHVDLSVSDFEEETLPASMWGTPAALCSKFRSPK